MLRSGAWAGGGDPDPGRIELRRPGEMLLRREEMLEGIAAPAGAGSGELENWELSGQPWAL